MSTTKKEYKVVFEYTHFDHARKQYWKQRSKTTVQVSEKYQILMEVFSQLTAAGQSLAIADLKILTIKPKWGLFWQAPPRSLLDWPL